MRLLSFVPWIVQGTIIPSVPMGANARLLINMPIPSKLKCRFKSIPSKSFPEFAWHRSTLLIFTGTMVVAVQKVLKVNFASYLRDQ